MALWYQTFDVCEDILCWIMNASPPSLNPGLSYRAPGGEKRDDRRESKRVHNACPAHPACAPRGLQSLLPFTVFTGEVLRSDYSSNFMNCPIESARCMNTFKPLNKLKYI